MCAALQWLQWLYGLFVWVWILWLSRIPRCECFQCWSFEDGVKVGQTVRSGCVPALATWMQRSRKTVAHFTFPLSLSPRSSFEVQARTQVMFWECAGWYMSCTCEANYLCDDLTVALRGRLCPHADKSPGGGKLYFFYFLRRSPLYLGRSNKKLAGRVWWLPWIVCLIFASCKGTTSQ